MRRLLLLAGINLLPLCYVHGQGVQKPKNDNKQKIVPILVGQKTPNLPFGEFFGESNLKNLSLGSLKGKLVILDFWNTHCGPCVAAMPKLDSIQKEYGDKIQIITITGDKRLWVEKLVNRLWPNELMLKNLPFLVNDSIFSRYYPSTSVPEEVWITGDGIIRAITEGDVVTRENVERMLSNSLTSLPQKVKKVSIDFVLIDSDIASSSLEKKFLITKGISSLHNTTGRSYYGPANELYRVHSYNRTMVDIFQYSLGINFPKSRIFIEGNVDTSLVFPTAIRQDNVREWTNENTFCYDIVFRPARGMSDAELREFGLRQMNDDLSKYFQNEYAVDVTIKNKSINSFVLESCKLKAEKANALEKTARFSRDTIYLVNHTLSELAIELGLTIQDFPLPFASVEKSESRYTFNFTKREFSEHSLLEAALNRNQVQFSRRIWPTEVLVISPWVQKTHFSSR
jgi:thiol-disulfide isomerase/thioredoxin